MSDDTMRGHPVIDRAEAIRVIRAEQDDLALLVMFLVDVLRDGRPVNHDLLRQRVAAKGRRALLERETALVTLGGDAYMEPPEWDWDELLDAVKRDGDIADLERVFNDESEGEEED
jgi:hypothetical protein